MERSGVRIAGFGSQGVVLAMVMLDFAVRATGMVSLDSLRKAVKNGVPQAPSIRL